MRAALGDQIAVEATLPRTPSGATPSGAARREGEIVGLHHSDGTPPFDVRSDLSGQALVPS